MEQNGIVGPFIFVLCLKVQGGYSLLGEYATATEAFVARRQLVASTGTASYFLRAVRVRPAFTEIDESDVDLFRDALRTGDESLVPSHQWNEYKAWAAKAVSARFAYRSSSPRNPF